MMRAGNKASIWVVAVTAVLAVHGMGSAQDSGPSGATLPISGFVRDGTTGEPLPYASLRLQDTQLGTIADVHGYYVINGVPAGEHVLIVTMIGYEPLEERVSVLEEAKRRFDLELVSVAIQIGESEVTAERTRFEREVEVSRVNITPRDLQATPSLIEPDVFRTIQQLPSVTSQNDFNSALIVRGGSPDENLIMVDGAEIYNPYHLGGLFSTFNADAISDAEFLAGGYPAEHPGRLSSILNIVSREGNSRQGKLLPNSRFGEFWDLSRAKGELSLLSSRAMAEGPSYRGAWILSGRRTYFDKLVEGAQEARGNDQDWAYFFWDNQFKIFADLNDQNRVTFSTFNGRDVLRFNFDEDDFDTRIDFDWDWGNNSSSLKWRSIPSTQYLSEFSLHRSSFDFDVNLELVETDSLGRTERTDFVITNSIRDVTATETLTWFVNDRHTLAAGLSLKQRTMEFDFEIDRVNYFDIREEPYVLSGFLQDTWQVSEPLSLQLGLRGSKYELHDRAYLDPRLGFKYLLTDRLSLNGSWGRFHQFMFTTNDENQVLRVVDFWQPVPEQFDAMSNQHFVLGLDRWFQEGLSGSIEAYYKPYDNILTSNPGNDPGLEDDEFATGKGRVWGLEMSLRKTAGRLTGWLGYSYSNLERRFDFNGDGRIRRADNEWSEIYAPKYSKPHSFNLVASYQKSDKTQLSMAWTIGSGQPYTPVVGKVFHGARNPTDPFAELIDVRGQRNSSRVPLYVRGDLAWVRSISLFGLKGKFHAQVMNVTNHFNVLMYLWDHNQSPSEVKAISMFPIFPSIGLEFEL